MIFAVDDAPTLVRRLAERVEFWGDEIEKISEFDPLTGEMLVSRTSLNIYPQ